WPWITLSAVNRTYAHERPALNNHQRASTGCIPVKKGPLRRPLRGAAFGAFKGWTVASHRQSDGFTVPWVDSSFGSTARWLLQAFGSTVGWLDHYLACPKVVQKA